MKRQLKMDQIGTESGKRSEHFRNLRELSEFMEFLSNFLQTSWARMLKRSTTKVFVVQWAY